MKNKKETRGIVDRTREGDNCHLTSSVEMIITFKGDEDDYRFLYWE